MHPLLIEGVLYADALVGGASILSTERGYVQISRLFCTTTPKA